MPFFKLVEMPLREKSKGMFGKIITGEQMQLAFIQLGYGVETNHAHINEQIRPMLGFKKFRTARATLYGIELHHMLRKGQHINAQNMTIFEQFYNLAA